MVATNGPGYIKRRHFDCSIEIKMFPHDGPAFAAWEIKSSLQTTIPKVVWKCSTKLEDELTRDDEISAHHFHKKEK